ncbi:MAG: threonine/serine exporter family protein [Chloroflexota bacterium]
MSGQGNGGGVAIVTSREDPGAAGNAYAARAVEVALRTGVMLLESGAETTDTERAMRRLLSGVGLAGAEALVTYSIVAVSYVAGGGAHPTTAMRAVPRWHTNYARLAAVADVARALSSGDLTLDDAEAALDKAAATRPPYPGWALAAAAGASAAGLTVLFGGSPADALLTLAVGVLVQPVVAAVDRTRLPPLFQTAAGVAVTTALITLLATLGYLPNASLVLTGAILRFLPGSTLVAGMRDLMDRSIVSGTARLAEALLLGAAVAGSLGMVISVAASFGVRLQISLEGATDWPLAVLVVASAVAVAFYAIGLGVPKRVLLTSSLVGALATLVGQGLLTSFSLLGEVLTAALVVGVLSRVLARRMDAPWTLWAVPAVLVLLPGLTIVRAMLATSAVLQVSLLADALLAAFAIGVGVATGDIVVSTYLQIREQIVDPVAGAVAGGIDRLVTRSGEPRAEPDEDASEPTA